MTLADADVYAALRAANVPEELAEKAAAAVAGDRSRRGIALPPFLSAFWWPATAIAAGIALAAAVWLLLSLAFPSPVFGPASVRCFSNGHLIYEGRSEGAVDRGWTGIAFRDAAGHRTRIRGDCVIVYD